MKVASRFILVLCASLGTLFGVAHGASYLTYVSDLLSTSAPSASADQTILFTLNQAVPASGAIELYFDEGGFIVPATGFNFGDIDLGFSAAAGGPYTQRPLSSIATPGTDGVTVTTGTAGNIRIKLNSTVGIPAGNQVQVKIGTNATFGAIGDTPMQLNAATGSYPVTIYTYDASDVELDYGRTMIAVVEQVTIGPVDTTDQIPPIITFAEPTGLLQSGTTGVELWVITNEPSSCRYATSSMVYASMPYTFAGTSTGLVEWHFAQELGLVDDTTYTYYIRCIDFRLNEIDPDYVLEFTIGIPPGSTTTATTTTPGSGTGTASTTASSTCVGPDCTGTGTGSGTGGSGSGSGSSDSGGDGAGSGSGGSGSSGTGTKLPQADIRIDGWAYPGATVSFLRDGIIVDDDAAEGGGEFSHLTEGLDRGSYTFGVYAVDGSGTRSATFSTTLWLRSETLNTLSNIMLPPTVRVEENSVQPGSPVLAAGYSAPNAEITTWLRPKLAEVTTGDIVSTTTAATNGAWSLSIPTTGLSQGTYELVAQGAMPDSVVESDKSARLTIGVGVQVEDLDCGSTGDLNCDGFVNLVDFSILVFNWNSASEVADINDDGIVSLPDFSIMLYYWTG